jgi:hypothetical protein
MCELRQILRPRIGWRLAVVLGVALLGPDWADSCRGGDEEFQIDTVDKATGKPVAARMHLKNQAGRPRLPKGVPSYDDHFTIPGSIVLKLPLGEYTFELERGLEYKTLSGHFTIARNAHDTRQIELERCADLPSEGWYSGDLDVHRPARDLRSLMEADDVHVVPLIAWDNVDNPWHGGQPPQPLLVPFGDNFFCHLLGGQQKRPGGTLSLLNLERPLKLGPAIAEYPPTPKYLEHVRKQPGVWVDLTRPYWWDLPLLVALGQIDSIQVAHGQICRAKTIANEEGGKPRDLQRLPGPMGNAKWSQEIYFHLLNCGLRIPPSAGSGSGIAPNPVGFNRMYAFVEGPFSYQKWWESVKAGRVVVTNSPLMRPTVHGEPPGHVFTEAKDTPVEYEIGLTISLREPLNYLEIIKNGRVEQEVRFAQYAKTGRLPKIKFNDSGWFLIRAVTDQSKTYRFAMTGPYYVEMGYRQRISRRSVQFFLDWLTERARQLEIDQPDQRREVLEYYRRARDFWQDRLAKANAE